jgi:adenosylcobinamide-phosphate synthase
VVRRRGFAPRAAAVSLGLLCDRAFGEPPAALHPVAGFGTLMERVEDASYDDSVAAGLLYAGAGIALGLLAGRTVRNTTLAVTVAVAGRSLRNHARGVHDALDAGDLDRARTLLPALVGRDPSALDASGVAAAVIESVAENSVDAVVAPALWAFAAGSPGVFAYRAVNTMDAMVGNHSDRYERYGTSSARLDDVANYVPARLTALLTLATRPQHARRIARAVRDDAPAHPSPNAGVAEAAFAGALGVQLGGTLQYGDRVEERPLLGRGPRPQPPDILRAVRLASDVELLLAGAAATTAIALARPWRRR